MGCFNMYILNREGTCLCYHEWRRPRPCDLPPEDDQKNMFGLLFALRTFAAALDPIRYGEGVSKATTVIRNPSTLTSINNSANKPALGESFRIGDGCSFHSFRTNNYKLHFMESPSGFKVRYIETSKMCPRFPRKNKPSHTMYSWCSTRIQQLVTCATTCGTFIPTSL